MEIGESAAEGAIRETWEEAHAEVEVVSPFAHLDIPLIGQVRGEMPLISHIDFSMNLLKVLKLVVVVWSRLT